MNSKSYSDQANQYKCPLGRHWQIQEQALIAMLNLMENMVRHALHLLIGYFSTLLGGGVVSKCVDLFIPSLICHIFSVIDIDSIIIIEGDWTTSWPEEEDQEDDISEGLNQFFYTNNYMSV